MDKKVITRVIKYYSKLCPDFKYENPLLDKDVADLFAKGLIKLLNENVDDNHTQRRELILQTIINSCKVQPADHLYIPDNMTEVLRNAYEELSENFNINKDLDNFLIRNLKETNIASLHSPHFKPDIIQALRNLNNHKQKINAVLVKDVIYWNVDNNSNGYLDILESIWNADDVKHLCKIQPDDISIKMKPVIEKIILHYAAEMMDTEILDDHDWFYNNFKLKKLVKICCVSSECFQICCSIMNSIFMKTNFDINMRKFITLFISGIHNNEDSVNITAKHISLLYPAHLQHIVVLLNINLKKLTGQVQKTYLAQALKLLNRLHKDCQSDLIMLLSHFNDWFNIYYDNNKIQ